jgi:hypothetical protein
MNQGSIRGKFNYENPSTFKASGNKQPPQIRLLVIKAVTITAYNALYISDELIELKDAMAISSSLFTV